MYGISFARKDMTVCLMIRQLYSDEKMEQKMIGIMHKISIIIISFISIKKLLQKTEK